MKASAIIMMVFGLVITWGGATVCLTIALTKHKMNEQKKSKTMD